HEGREHQGRMNCLVAFVSNGNPRQASISFSPSELSRRPDRGRQVQRLGRRHARLIVELNDSAPDIIAELRVQITLVAPRARRYSRSASGALLAPGPAMKCPKCRHENAAEAKFCEQCAAPLAGACAKCGSQVSSTAKFCAQCGHPLRPVAGNSPFFSPKSYTPQHLANRILTSRAAVEGERKQVTVLFADIKGSMEFVASRDPEDAQKLLDPALERMIEAVHHFEGTVNRVMGDGIMALFGAPLAHEDHAVRACYAALRMQEAVARYSDEMQRVHGMAVTIRVGINSGEAVVCAIGNDLHLDYTVVGQTVHVAARMEQMANPGCVLTTAGTFQ